MVSNTTIANVANDEMFYFVLCILCMIGCFVSPIFLVVHLYKFFMATAAQNLPSKNLASYCICSLIMYASMALTCFTGIYRHDYFIPLKAYLYMASSFLLLNMSLDTYLCMKKSVKSFRASMGSRGNAFVLYTIFAWGVSLVATVIIFLAMKSSTAAFNVVLATTMVMRLICLGLFCISTHYIKSADISNSHKLKTNVFMHARLLLINGITSILWYATVAAIYFLETDYNVLMKFSVFLSVILYAYDGVFVALCYTFKKGMFEGGRRESMKNVDLKRIEVIRRESSYLNKIDLEPWKDKVKSESLPSDLKCIRVFATDTIERAYL